MKRNQMPSKEGILKYYIEELHTVQECCDFFNIGKTKFYRCLKKYGIERTKEDKGKVYSRTQSSPELKDRIKNSKLERYGDTKSYRFVSDSTFIIKETPYTVEWLINEYCNKNTPLLDILSTLGVSSTVFYEICHHYNICKTNEQRYENIEKTTKEKYGVKSSLQLEDVKEKSKQSSLKKYGVDNPMKSEGVKQKIVDTLIKRYGVDNNRRREIQHNDIWSSEDKLREYLLSFGEDRPNVYNLSLHFNVSVSGLRKRIHQLNMDDLITWYYSRSHYEDDLVKYLQEKHGLYNVLTNDRSVLGDQEIDIYLPDYKMGIEFNGDYWHSDIYNTDHNGRSTYHQEKSLLAESKGVFLFHIFEHEWNDPVVRDNILNRLDTLLYKNSKKVGARKCSIVELTKEQKKTFLDINHIQGNDHSTKQYGLTYNDELVACMTFVHPKNNKYTWELSRFCNKRGYSVQGGASKLFNYFVDTLNIGDTVSSYNDITKTKGDIYKTLGFECVSINQPNYVWINFQTEDIRTRYQEQAAGEIERMHSKGYHRVCDCGTKTWVYTKK